MKDGDASLRTYRDFCRPHENGKVCEVIAGTHCVCSVRMLSNHVTTFTCPSSFTMNSAVDKKKKMKLIFSWSINRILKPVLMPLVATTTKCNDSTNTSTEAREFTMYNF